MRSSRLGLLLFVCLLIAALGAACGSSNGGSTFVPGGDASLDGSGDSSGGSSGGDGSNLFGDGSGGDGATGPLAISPANSTIVVPFGTQSPTVKFTATAGGQTVNASFSIDLAQIAGIVASTGVMTPTGKVGGTANVTATFGAQTATTKVTVVVQLVANGGGAASDAGGGAGGNGGVGGSPPGGPVPVATQTLLQGTLTADTGLAWLYPYDKTVWPQGLLAPLLQWNAPRNYDSVYIHLHETGFDYQGYFAATATPYVNAPIPQAAWDTLSYSNQGEPVTVTLAFSSGGVAYGPLTETWTIAQGPLTGTVYYNSYGTNLAHNYCCTVGGAQFGGATLAIKHGATSPVLVAGNNTECRVCHSVSADGSRLVTEQGSSYPTSSWYDLKNANAETTMNPQGTGQFAWPAMYPDGTMLLTDAAPLSGGGWAADAQLFNVSTGASMTATGIPTGLRAGSPVFSPDGTHVAFNFYGGTVNGKAADGVSLAAMDYAPATSTFSNFRVLYTPAAGVGTALWPSFMPTNDAVVFELQTVYNGRDWGGTRSTCDSSAACSNSGTQAELWWVDLATSTATRLDGLNGKGYLPTLPATQHTDDSTLNYEPTVNPVPSGGYAWVVFTSRRLYGNIATINPYWSDPRFHDISVTPTPKKLWVAAIDLNAKAGTDPSQPAFYLPAQELLAGNSRGYWVVDPCEQNGSSCLTGDQCCSGFCEDVDGGFVCGTQPPGCSGLSNKCTVASDCCGYSSGIQCIDGFCAQAGPQ